MQGKLIASYRRELSALDDLQCAGTVTGHGRQRVCCVR